MEGCLRGRGHRAMNSTKPSRPARADVSPAASDPAEGFTFTLQSIARRFDPREWSRFDAFNMGPPRSATEDLAPELLRFGVQIADGSRATSLDFVRYAAAPDDPPQPPLLQPRGGGGGGGY